MRATNSELLDRIYGQYCHKLYMYLLSLCRDPDTAEDLLQETFLKALLTLPDSNTNIRSWLYIVARNLYYDRLREKRHYADDADLDICPADSSGQPLEKVLSDERNKLLYEALSRLDRQKREVLELQYFGGLSQLEISEIMGLRPGYVRVLALRARREIRLWMEENGYDLP